MRTKWKKRCFCPALYLIAILTFSIVLLSCPQRISEDNVRQAKDAVGPVVTILSPQDESAYFEVVTVSGLASDFSGDSGEKGNIKTMRYEIIGFLGTLESSDITCAMDGSFSFEFNTLNIDGPVEVRVQAEDWNGNIGEDTVTLADPGSELPSFTAKPGNGKVELSWSALPGVDQYTIYYTKDGSTPSDTYGERIGPLPFSYPADDPLIIDNLRNGNMHIFLLQARDTDRAENWLSSYEKAIPLSPMTLAPTVTGEFMQIKVQWDVIPATEEFAVERSTEKDGEYINIAGEVRGNSIIDGSVQKNQGYYYRITPTLGESLTSAANFGEICPYPPSEERSVGHNFLGSGCGDIALSGDYVYVADTEMGLWIVDITDPKNPSVKGHWDTPEQDMARSVALTGNYACVADETAGLWVIDISNPEQPTDVGHWDPDYQNYAWGVAASGNTVYVAAADTGLWVIDISDPEHPTDVGHWVSADWNPNDPEYDLAFSVDVQGDYACIAGYVGGMWIVDVSDPSILDDPSFDQYWQWKPVGFSYAYGASIKGNYAYAADTASLWVVDISNPSQIDDPTFDQFWQWQPSGMTTAAVDATVSGDFAYVAGFDSGLWVVDVSDPSQLENPSFTNFLQWDPDGHGNTVSVAVGGEYAYVADGSGGIWIIDVSRPSNPVDVGRWDQPGDSSYSSHDVSVSGGYAYVADWYGNLWIIDISNPSGPFEVGHWDPWGHDHDHLSYGVAVSGDYAYVADGHGGLWVVDISDPSQVNDPSRYWGWDPPGHMTAYDVVVRGDYAYLADGEAGLWVIDISDPPKLEDPLFNRYWQWKSDEVTSIQDIDVYDSYAFIVDTNEGMWVIDISDPLNLTDVAHWNPGGENSSWSVVVRGYYAYVANGYRANGTSGLWIFDISDPLDIENSALSQWDPPDFKSSQGVAVSGDYAYLAESDNGLWILDVSDPANPILVAHWDVAEQRWAHAVEVCGGYAYVADDTAGLWIIDLSY